MKCVRGKKAAGDQFFSELDLAGGEGGGGGFGKRAIEQFVVEELVGDLGEAVGGEDGNGEGEAVAGIIVRLRDEGGEALAEFFQAGEVEDSEVTGGVVVEEEDLGHGGVGGGGLIGATSGKLLHDLLDAGPGHIGFGQPVQSQEKIFRHPARGAQFGTSKGIGQLTQVFQSGLRLFENVHAGGGGHRIEHQVIVPRAVVPAKETILILEGWIERLDEGRGGVCGLPKGAKEDNQEKGGTHKERVRGNAWVESEEASPAQLGDNSESKVGKM